MLKSSLKIFTRNYTDIYTHSEPNLGNSILGNKLILGMLTLKTALKLGITIIEIFTES